MQLEIFKRLSRFYEANHTLPAHADDDIMDLFRYYYGRDLILEASSVLDRNTDNQNTELVGDNEDMDNTSVMH